jgi:hypothetical protein
MEIQRLRREILPGGDVTVVERPDGANFDVGAASVTVKIGGGRVKEITAALPSHRREGFRWMGLNAVLRCRQYDSNFAPAIGKYARVLSVFWPFACTKFDHRVVANQVEIDAAIGRGSYLPDLRIRGTIRAHDNHLITIDQVFRGRPEAETTVAIRDAEELTQFISVRIAFSPLGARLAELDRRFDHLDDEPFP